MARETYTLDTGTWVLLTTSDVTAARVQNHGPYTVLIQATASTTPPVNEKGALLYEACSGFDASVTLTNNFPDMTGAGRFWAKTTAPTMVSKVSVVHA